MKNKNEYIKTYKSFLGEIFPMQSKVRKIPVHGGMTCPNLDGKKGTKGCVYCDNKSFSPAAESEVHVSLQIEAYLECTARVGFKYLAYFQPFSNTYGTVEILKEKFTSALLFEDVIGLCVGTRPDCLDEEKLDMIMNLQKAYNKPIIIELGLQSGHDETLKKINRGHTTHEFLSMVSQIRERGLNWTTHVILGLPGETTGHMLETAKLIGALNPGAVKIHPIHVVKDTVLAEWYAEGSFTPLSFEEYINILTQFLEVLSPHTAIERFSGDALGDALIAPDWVGDRVRIENALMESFEKKGTKQGFYSEMF